MSLNQLVTHGEVDSRTDKVAEAYAELRRLAVTHESIPTRSGTYAVAELEAEAFREAIADEVAYGHQKIADALNHLGFSIDRKQVHNYREKLRLGRVAL